MQRYLASILIMYLIMPIGDICAQSKIEIINADEISFNQKLNKNRQVLRGNVKIKHENRIMTCDSAYYYSNENIIEAFNNIHIHEEDSISLKGEYLIYNGNQQLAEIEKKVMFTHNDMCLYTEKLNYNFISKKGFFNQQAHITKDKKSITSNEGEYDCKREKFKFYKNVVLIDQTDTLIADSVFYSLKTDEATFTSNGIIKTESLIIKAMSGWVNQSKGDAILNGDIQMHHLLDGAKLFSDHCLIQEQKNTSIAFGNALIEIPSKNDTLYLMGDTLSYIDLEDKGIFTASSKAIFQSNEILGKCDSLVYLRRNNEMTLFFLPAIWIDEFLLSSDTISIKYDTNQYIKKTELNKNAFISSMVNSQQFNQIKGEEMTAHFSKNKLDNVEVDGNGESIYYIEEEDQRYARGVNKVQCSRMNISISGNQIERIVFHQNADSFIKPIEQVIPENMLLKNFIWYKKQETSLKLEKRINQYPVLLKKNRDNLTTF